MVEVPWRIFGVHVEKREGCTCGKLSVSKSDIEGMTFEQFEQWLVMRIRNKIGIEIRNPKGAWLELNDTEKAQ